MSRVHSFPFLIPALILGISTHLIFAQQPFIYDRGEKILLTISAEKISMKFQTGVTPSQIQDIVSRETVLGELKPLVPGITENFFTARLIVQVDVSQLLARLRETSGVALVNPVYVKDGIEAIPFDHFVVKFR